MDPARLDCDVCILGGGMAGAAAAIAAAASGARTILLERQGFLGGAATAGAVSQFVGWRTRAGRKVIAGVADDIVAALKREGAAAEDVFVMSTGHQMDRVSYDPDVLKVVLDRVTVSAGVQVVFHAAFADCDVVDGRVPSIRIATPGGLVAVDARVFVDASGDLPLLAAAGAQFLATVPAGRQPATMMMAMAPVDFDRLDAVTPAEKSRIVETGLASGALPRAALHYSRAPGRDVAWFNISRVEADPTDAASLSAAEMAGREQCLKIAEFLRRELPGCEAARLSQFAPALGVRDTRRVLGDYVLTVEDLRAGVAFPDAIACGAYPIDIHHGGDAGLTVEEFGEDHFYRVPYRSLLAKGLDNVATAGRGLSADAKAFAAVRVMPSAMATGHGAGVAAALAAAGNSGELRAINTDRLRQSLIAQGAYLG